MPDPRGEPRANGAQPRPRTDALLGALGRAALAVFYSEIEIIGLENFPKSGGTIVVGNHSNSLIDAVVIISTLPRMPRFLAASTVWDYTPIVPLLSAAGAVPVFRQQDGRQNDGDTSKSLSAAANLLAAGGILAVFPEGKSHNEAALLPMKSGTARIALEAEHVHGPLGLQIIPVGMMFESKNVFRSRVLIEVGEPVAVDAHHSAQIAVRDAVAARKLTDRVSRGLEAVTPNYDSWEEAHLIEHAADMWLQARSELPSPSSIVDTANVRKEFRTGYATLRQTHPELIEQVGGEIAHYMALLHDAGLRDELVVSAHHNEAFSGALLRAFGAWVVRLPVSLLGVLLNGIPFFVLLRLSRRQDLDKRATWSVFAGLFLFPAFWMLSAIISGLMMGARFGATTGVLSAVAVLVAAPLSGLVAIKSGETRKRALQSMRAWYLLRVRKNIGPKLINQRASVLGMLSNLWETAFGEKS